MESQDVVQDMATDLTEKMYGAAGIKSCLECRMNTWFMAIKKQVSTQISTQNCLLPLFFACSGEKSPYRISEFCLVFASFCFSSLAVILPFRRAGEGGTNCTPSHLIQFIVHIQ